MIKVILVDDEDIEREAMAEIVPWEKLDMELVDSAWNGIEGLEKIKTQVPDIVVTDIKMPVMDGLQLIQEAKKIYPDLFFVVLSGYGEFEYTSKAMELGIRHYILKPCDETKIVEVLEQVKKELEEQRCRKKTEREYKSTFARMLPRVKEQILGQLISQKELSRSDELLLGRFMENVSNAFVLFGIRGQEEWEQLDQFVLTNILTELLGADHIYMSTCVKKDMVYLLPENMTENLLPLTGKVSREYGKYKKEKLSFAVSRSGEIEDVSRLYEQLQEQFFLNELGTGTEGRPTMILDHEKIRASQSYQELVFEIYVSYIKMCISGFSTEKAETSYRIFLENFCEWERKEWKAETVWDILECVVDSCAERLGCELPDTKEGMRTKNMIWGIYQNIKNPDLSLQFLAKEILFMNEDYFGRLFYRVTNEKYSAFLVRIRVELAKRLMEFDPDMKVAELAEQIGYPADGQYFAKVFKKNTGMVPSEYRRQLQMEG